MEFDKYKNRGAYHWIEYENNTLYGQHVNKLLSWMRKDGRTLDIGAGDGLITHLLDAEGIDDNKIAIKLAKEKNANVLFGDAYKLNYDDNTFDNVLMADVIEHLEFPDIAIKEVKRVLKPDGYFYVVTPPAREDGVLQDKYHYIEYSPNKLSDYLSTFDFDLTEAVEVVSKYVRMYGVYINQK